MALATDPDQIAAAIVDILKPGGVPVGNLGDVVRRTPDSPYRAALPVLQVRPTMNVNQHPMAAGRPALGFMDEGVMDLIYRDATPAQQAWTLSQVEDAMWTARNAIVAALRANPTLHGAITICAERIEEAYNPDGPFDVWEGAEFVVFVLRVSYQGPLL